MAYKKNYRRRGTVLGKAAKVASKASIANKGAKMANVAALSKRVTTLTKRIYKDNEMKHYAPTGSEGYAVGQVSGNNSGTLVHDLSVCNIGQGLDEDNRIGRQVTLKGIHLRFQLIQQSAATVHNRVIVEIWKTSDMQVTGSTFRSLIYDTDSISGVIDANSTINKEFSRDIYKCIARRNIYFKGDVLSGATEYRDFKMFIKQNQELSYSQASAQVPQNVRYFLVMRCQAGNLLGTASTLSTIPVTAANTGFTARFQHTDYYIDN